MSEQQQAPIPIRVQNAQTSSAMYDLMRTSLGARGSDKLLVDGLGEITVTNDGNTILNNITLTHPSARIIAEASQSTDTEIGDGTTSTAVLASSIIKEMSVLIDKGIHPNTIRQVLSKISPELCDYLANLSREYNSTDFENIVNTTLSSKVLAGNTAFVKALSGVKTTLGKNFSVENIRIHEILGGSLDDITHKKGIFFDKLPEVPFDKMDNPKIILLDEALEIDVPNQDVQIQSNDMMAITENRHVELQEKSKFVKRLKPNVVLGTRGIDDHVKHYLGQAGIVVIPRVLKSDLVAISEALDIKIIKYVKDATSENVGTIDRVEYIKETEKEPLLFLQDDKLPNTIVISGGNEKIVKEATRSAYDAIRVTTGLVKSPYIVKGAGNAEICMAKYLNSIRPSNLSHVHIYKALASAILSIPKNIAQNAGMNLLDCEAAIETAEDTDGIVLDDEPRLGDASSVIEPLALKQQVIKASIEAAITILGVDQMLQAQPKPGSV